MSQVGKIIVSFSTGIGHTLIREDCDIGTRYLLVEKKIAIYNTQFVLERIINYLDNNSTQNITFYNKTNTVLANFNLGQQGTSEAILVYLNNFVSMEEVSAPKQKRLFEGM